jgi:hypothetical protein
VFTVAFVCASLGALALIDPQWSGPVNTALLIILALVTSWRGRQHARRAERIRKEVVDVKLKCGADRRQEDQEAIHEVRSHVHTDIDPDQSRRWIDQEEGDQ